MVRCLMQNNVFGHAYISIRVYDEVTAAAFERHMAPYNVDVVFREDNIAGELNSSKEFLCY